MEIRSNYDYYILSLEEAIKHEQEPIDIVFSGEWNVLKVVEKYQPKGVFYCLDLLDEDMALLVKAEHSKDSLRILSGFQLDFSMHKIAAFLGINDSDQSAFKWLNMCFYRNSKNEITYDKYYDRLYASNYNDKRINELLDEIQRTVNSIPEDSSGCRVYLLGELADFNPLIYVLQCRECQVVSVPSDVTTDDMDAEKRLLQLKKQMLVPYCDNEVFTYHFTTADYTDTIPPECFHPYILSLLYDNSDVNSTVLGNYTLRDMLNNNKGRCDYKSCGEEYMYLELTFYSDLFGNTLLKCINSEETGDSSLVIVLNKFELN